MGGEGRAAEAIGCAGPRLGAESAAQAPHDLAVVLVLIQRHVIVRGFYAGSDDKAPKRVPFIFGKGHERLGNEVFVEITEGRVLPGHDVGWNLIAVGIGPIVPGAGAEDSPPGCFAEGHGVAGMAVAVELVDAAGLRRAEADGRAVLVVLLVPITGGVSLGVELPTVAQVGVVGGVFEVGLHVIEVEAEIIWIRSACREELISLKEKIVSILGNL